MKPNTDNSNKKIQYLGEIEKHILGTDSRVMSSG